MASKKITKKASKKKRTVTKYIAAPLGSETDEEIQASIARMLLGIIAIAIFIVFFLAPEMR